MVTPVSGVVPPIPLRQEKVYEVDMKAKSYDKREVTDTLRVTSTTSEGAAAKALTWIKQLQEQLKTQHKDSFDPDTDHEVTATRFVDMVII